MLFFLAVMTGLICGAMGSGGGAAAVLMFAKTGCSQRSSQARAVKFTGMLCLPALAVFTMNDGFRWETLPVAAGGCVGALIGVRLLKHADDQLMKLIFGLLLVFSSCKLLFF